MKKLFIETYGCQMNVADSEVVASVMQMAGYETCDSVDEADAVFLNTCSVRDNAEQKIYHRLDALDAIRRKRPLIIGVLGCMAERVKEDLLQHHHANLVAGLSVCMGRRLVGLSVSCVAAITSATIVLYLIPVGGSVVVMWRVSSERCATCVTVVSRR